MKLSDRKPVHRYDIIQYLINKNRYKRFLEIGVEERITHDNIDIGHKDGVDPNGAGNFTMTSDKFFEKLDHNIKYDIFFVDGLHEKEQVEKDLNNSLKHLQKGGTIVMHDCNPPNEEYQDNPPNWCGDTWKAFLKFRNTREDLFMQTVDADLGCGIVQMGKQDFYPTKENMYTWDEFIENREKILKLISVDEFEKQY